MHRCLRPLLTILAGLLLLQCANRKWENIYDPESPTYPQMEYFVFDGYEEWEGYYILWWRLKFVDVVSRSYPFVAEFYYEGSLSSTFTFDMPSGYVGTYLYVASSGPFAIGKYRMLLKYGGEEYAEAEYRVSRSFTAGRRNPEPGFHIEFFRVNVR